MTNVKYLRLLILLVLLISANVYASPFVPIPNESGTLFLADINKRFGGPAGNGTVPFTPISPYIATVNITSAQSPYSLVSTTITNAVWSANIATITSAGHGFRSNQWVNIVGINPSGYNGVAQITGVTTNNFTYTLATNPGSYISGGTVIAIDYYLTCDSTSGNITINLPAATGTGREIKVKEIASDNSCTISANGSDTIDGLASFVLSSQYSYVSIVDSALGIWSRTNIVSNSSCTGEVTLSHGTGAFTNVCISTGMECFANDENTSSVNAVAVSTVQAGSPNSVNLAGAGSDTVHVGCF